MAKKFASRVSKKQRTKIDNLASLDDAIFRLNDQKLLQGARLDDIDLSKITVKKQVRTKFNDDSIRELAANIEENGLIQPLVVHREGNKYVLICGERRFRAMSTIKSMTHAPCFILEDKTPEELMAIQFSENSAREQLHYIDQADSIAGYKKLTGASERKIQAALGISKTEVNRCLKIAKVPRALKEAAKMHDVEKYVLLEWNELENGAAKNKIKKMIVDGEITKRLHLKRSIKAEGGIVKTSTAKGRKTAVKKQPKISGEDLEALLTKTKGLKVDKKTKNLLNELIKQSQG